MNTHTEHVKDMKRYTCADCGQVTAVYDANDPVQSRIADSQSWMHSCKQQRAANRRAQKAQASK